MVQLLLVAKGVWFCKLDVVGELPTYTFQPATLGGDPLTDTTSCSPLDVFKTARALGVPSWPAAFTQVTAT
jgi:hypothetical protein